ncbi:speckle-type POZ protein B-like [Uloborus diversus]|uniref:speckle-type POZ protein B-like n=1 Tax=Uloborus diversus TaxID=327109 RepID=UPI002409F27D|nr:speckle-type POZ protein B-like [Uloborus diversus]
MAITSSIHQATVTRFLLRKMKTNWKLLGGPEKVNQVASTSYNILDETPSYVREFKHLFNAKSVSNVYPGFLDAESRFTVQSELLKDDTLTVLCELTVTDGAVSTEILKSCHDTDREIDLKSLPRNLLSLLKSEKYSDMVLKCEDDVLNVHKCILAARSPVFERMFENEMAEAKTGTVIVKDISSSVMKLLIMYVYSNDLHDLSMEHAPELYTAADKYELIDLRIKCSQFMHAHMDVDSACDVLILADLHQDKVLKASAKDFISRRAGQTLLTPQGRQMMENHPNLAYDILENLSAVYCTLPPQEFHDKKSKQDFLLRKSKDITEMNG